MKTSRPTTRKSAPRTPSGRQGAVPDNPAAEPREKRHTEDLARRTRALRNAAGLTLQDLSLRSGISVSTLSKLENNQLSPTYDNIVRLAKGLGTDIASLFANAPTATATGRRSITLAGSGAKHTTPNYVYEMLCTDLSNKRMVPAVVTVRKGEIREFGPLITHEGDDLLYVLSGEVILYTEFYEPTRLKAGDCAYFDSRMGHGCISTSADDAIVLWVCSTDIPKTLTGLHEGPVDE